MPPGWSESGRPHARSVRARRQRSKTSSRKHRLSFKRRPTLCPCSGSKPRRRSCPLRTTRAPLRQPSRICTSLSRPGLVA
eukprot:15449825-Alexandrium_andersonii.AAC.1